jgi:SNF2 family DNA or RNA helicase
MKIYPLTNDRIAVEFAYNPQLIAAIKMVKGRKWNPLFKYWEVPLNELNIDTLRSIGFSTEDFEEELQRMQHNKNNQFNDFKKIIREKYNFLFNFQVDAIAKALVNERLLIADDTGLGKTLEALTTIDYKLELEKMERAVVCCPSAVKWQWKREIDKFFPKRTSIIIKGSPYERKKLYKKDFDIYIINYEQILRDFWEIFALVDKQLLCLDEASYIKNAKAKRTEFIQQFTPKYVLALTGTPIENKLQDVFNIGNVVSRGWMDLREFYDEYCIFQSQYGFNILAGYKNIDKFMEKLMRISIRRTKEDVAPELPGKVIYDRLISMSASQKKLENEIIESLRKEINDGNLKSIMPQFTLLPMLENSTELIKVSEAMSLKNIDKDKIKVDSPKINDLFEVIDELSDKKIVIFTRFKKMAEILYKSIEGREGNGSCVMGTGDTDKEKVITDFQNNKKFLIATDAYSYGVDMPFATTVINFDIPWNPARLKQREDRCYRITSKQQVKVINLICENGLEEYIYSVMKGKEDLFKSVMAFDIHKQLVSFVMRR